MSDVLYAMHMVVLLYFRGWRQRCKLTTARLAIYLIKSEASRSPHLQLLLSHSQPAWPRLNAHVLECLVLSQRSSRQQIW